MSQRLTSRNKAFGSWIQLQSNNVSVSQLFYMNPCFCIHLGSGPDQRYNSITRFNEISSTSLCFGKPILNVIRGIIKTHSFFFRFFKCTCLEVRMNVLDCLLTHVS